MIDSVLPLQESTWWLQKRDHLLNLAKNQLNAFIYDSKTIERSIESLKNMESIDKIFYAMKANFNPDLLRILYDFNINFECVSPGEVKFLIKTFPNIGINRILFTPNFSPKDEYIWAMNLGLKVTIDNLYPLKEWPEIFKNKNIIVRIDTGHGEGHHKHVKTAGKESKFGIHLPQVKELMVLVKSMDINIVGIHAHNGSEIYEVNNWITIAEQLALIGKEFNTTKFLDIGGGFPISNHSDNRSVSMRDLDDGLLRIKQKYPNYKFWIEPGRYLVGESGILLTHITQMKNKGDKKFIGVGTGMNSLIRPALYDAHHEIINLTRYHDNTDTELVEIVGPICESGDSFGMHRFKKGSREDDVILIANVGAYGSSMSSHYNLRELPIEIIL